MKRIFAIMICLLFPLISEAQWTGFPFRLVRTNFPFNVNTNIDTYNWQDVNTNYNPIFQIYTAICERCYVADVATPVDVQTWGASAGSNLYVFSVTNLLPSTNVYTYTNINWVVTNVIATNACYLGKFTYLYTNANGTNTGTYYPYLTQQSLVTLDNTIRALYSKAFFLSTNYTEYLQIKKSGNYPEPYLDLKDSFAGALIKEQIGYVTNIITNGWGFVTGGRASFTREPPQTNCYLLAECSYKSLTNWVFNRIEENHTNDYNATKPMIIFYPGSTNPFAAMTFTLAGSYLTNISLQHTATNTETITLSSTTGVQLVRLWWDVTNITSASVGNTNDTIAIIYTNNRAIYADWPFELYPEDLDERQIMVNRLRMNAINPGSNMTKMVYTEASSNMPFSASSTNDLTGTWDTWAAETASNFSNCWTNAWTETLFSGAYSYHYINGTFQTFTNPPPNRYNIDMSTWGGFCRRFYFYVTNLPSTNVAKELLFYVKCTNTYVGYVFPYTNFYGVTNVPHGSYLLWTNLPSSTNTYRVVDERVINEGLYYTNAPLDLSFTNIAGLILGRQQGAQSVYDPQLIIKWDFLYQ